MSDIKIIFSNGMVDIENEDISYSYMRGMYGGVNGVGVQLSPELEPERDKIMKLCDVIADSICELQDNLSEQTK